MLIKTRALLIAPHELFSASAYGKYVSLVPSKRIHWIQACGLPCGHVDREYDRAREKRGGDEVQVDPALRLIQNTREGTCHAYR